MYEETYQEIHDELAEAASNLHVVHESLEKGSHAYSVAYCMESDIWKLVHRLNYLKSITQTL